MKKQCVLVSGGAGYIGSHTAVELIEAGYDVVIADNLSNSDMSGVEGVRKITGIDVPFVEVDCCDKERLAKELFEQYDFDSVIHFAAYKAVGESVQKPLEYYRNNLTSLMNIIELMRTYGRHNIVFSGFSRASKIANSDLAVFIEQNVETLHISMYDVFGMQKTHSSCNIVRRNSTHCDIESVLLVEVVV